MPTMELAYFTEIAQIVLLIATIAHIKTVLGVGL
jgi:hypothetical protein